MKLKIGSEVIIALLFISVLIITFNIQPVKAESKTWTVDDDLLDCPDADFTKIRDAINAATTGDTIIVYPGTYIERLYVEKALTIESAEGSEATIIETPDPGKSAIYIKVDDVTINGFTVKGATEEKIAGIKLYGSESDKLENCIISNNNVLENYGGIVLYNSNSNELINNNVSNNYYGISLHYSNNNIISNNNLNSNSRGISLAYTSSNNIISQNNIVGTSIYYQIKLNDCRNNILSNNNASIIVWYSSNNNVLSNNTGSISLMSSDNNIVIDNNLSYFLLQSSGNNTLIGNRMSKFSITWSVDLSDYIQNIDESNKIDGKTIYYLVNQHNKQIPDDAGYVAIVNSTNIIVKDLSLTKNSHGILLAFSNNSKIENVNASNNDKAGVYLDHSNNNIVVNSIVSNNGYDVLGGTGGILLDYSNNNTIENTTISNTKGAYGIGLLNTYNTNIKQNLIFNNYKGINTQSSENNTIYLNNLIGNSYHVKTWTDDFWYSPEKIIYDYNNSIYLNYLGNYWDDYNSTDEDGDGIGDIHYTADYYPLMEPFENYSISVDEVPIDDEPTVSLNPPVLITSSQTITKENIKIEWNNVENAVSYNIFVNGIINETTSETSQIVMLWSNGSYTITVTSVNGTEESDESEPIIIVVELPSGNDGDTPAIPGYYFALIPTILLGLVILTLKIRKKIIF